MNDEDGTGSIGTGGTGGGGGVVGVGTSGGSLADEAAVPAAAEWFNNGGRLSSRTGGAGGSRWEGAGLLKV